MDPKFRNALELAVKQHAPDKHMWMPSAAVHDAEIFARYLPAWMLFVRSIAGISHHYPEDTKDKDIINRMPRICRCRQRILRGALPPKWICAFKS
jgi:beta-ureidopropionase / N-carbamoyl-L-amino-acid hydrolase